MIDKDDKAPPASAEAIAEGCTCNRALNHNGAGERHPEGTTVYHPEDSCPLHGLESIISILESER